ncbi:MAG TPA: hypothetical protein DD706_24435 [Nitrospiraceae bacterium]|nr:hypothetical protein [Nitrospiraceae bacterium]
MLSHAFPVFQVLSALILLASSVCVAEELTPSQPAKLALLIGIDKYKSPDIRRLSGAVNDIRLMREVLIGKFGMPPENINSLENEQATHQAIIDAIRNHLVAKAKKGDVVVLHFSGHGSQMKDISGDEVDQLDETLVAYDSRTPGVFDISDDEINGLLLQLTEKTKNVTFIFDSCHSGAASRGGNTVREIEADRRTPLPPEDFAVSVRGGEGDADFRPNNSDYVLISGSLAKELSNETDFEGRRHGVLTWFLALALKAAPDRSTYRDVMDQVKSEVSTRFPSQTPQIEGPGQDLVVFGVDKLNTKPYVLVEPAGGNRTRVEAGKVFGLGKESTMKVYPPRTTDFESTKSAATLRITRVSDFEAEGEISNGGSIQPHSRALLEAVSFGDTSIPVFVQKRSGPLSEVKATLAQMQAITLVDDEAGARLLVKEQDGNLLVQSGDLQVLVSPVRVSETDAVGHVIDQIKDLVHWLVVLALNNPSSGIKVGFSVWRATDPPGTPSPVAVASGTELIYRVENRHSQPLYIYVLDVSSDGSVTTLYPGGDQQQLLSGKELERHLRMSVPSGQVGVTDVLKIIATLKPIDPSLFPQGPIRSASKATAKATSDPLARFLASALRGARTAADVTVESDTWVTLQKPIQIRQEGAKLSSFALHFDGPKSVQDIRVRLSDNPALCSREDKPARGDCEQLASITNDGTVLEWLQRSASRETDQTVSVGLAFDEAYRIQDQTGAIRVEPQLEIQALGVKTEQGIDKRDITGDDRHDPAAAADDQWSLKQILVLEAWTKIRHRFDVAEGKEADGVIIAHPDTGYRHHPETWSEAEGKRPIDAGKGRNYYEGGTDALDPLLSDRLLDNPGHGTASGSVIVSPPGCQLLHASGCVNGIARGAQLIPLRVHRTVSQFNTRNLSQAIQDVADGNIAGNPRLIAIAMGGPPTFTMWKAVKTAEKNGVLIVAAAGNYVGTVVWPARFHSSIAVAAGNVRCQPWTNSSHGSAVDIMAPGESVWRATFNEQHEDMNGMGKGTTFASGNVAGAAALWLSWHRDDPSLRMISEQGLLTRAFRAALRSSAWRPSSSVSANPPGTYCHSSAWDTDYGAGILNVAGLLDVPLSGSQPRAALSVSEETVPLFASLYPEGTEPERIRSDYLSLFPAARSAGIEKFGSFETEILYHYTVNEDLRRKMDALAGGQRGEEPAESVRQALFRQDLSGRLRQALLQ